MNTTNERPTPETDAMLHADWNGLEEYSAPLSAYRRMTALCRTLERERDKATENATNYFARLGEVERERDEAREQLRLANIDCYAALTELDAARELADRVAGERDESSAQLAAKRALADRLAGILDLYYADDTVAHHAGIADALTAWKEARMIDAAIDANKISRMIELC